MIVSIHLLSATLFDGDADRITLMTPMGEISVLEHHTPLVSLVEYGPVVVESGGTEQSFSFPGGILAVRPGRVTVLAKHV